MRMNKKDLAAKLAVSERALTTWQREGLPVLEHGRRGQPNKYDLSAVVRWLRSTGRGQDYRVGRNPIDLAALERELSMGAVQTPAPATCVSPVEFAGALALARLDLLDLLSDDDDHLIKGQALFHVECLLWFVEFRLHQIMGSRSAAVVAQLTQIQRGSTSIPAGQVLVETLEDAIEIVRALVPAAVQRLTQPEFSPLYGENDG